MKMTQKGFGIVSVLLVVGVLGAVGATGWFVFQKNKPANPRSTIVKTQAAKQQDKKIENVEPAAVRKAPESWLKYRYPDSLLSFYYPPAWEPSDFKLYTGLKYDCVSMRYGTPAASKFNESTQKWESILNCGESEYQKVIEPTGDDWSLKTVMATNVSNEPIAYYATGHASVGTHDILVIHKDIVYQLRLPSINSFDYDNEPPGTYEKLWKAQAAAMPDIIKSIEFAKLDD